MEQSDPKATHQCQPTPIFFGDMGGTVSRAGGDSQQQNEGDNFPDQCQVKGLQVAVREDDADKDARACHMAAARKMRSMLVGFVFIAGIIDERVNIRKIRSIHNFLLACTYLFIVSLLKNDKREEKK